MIQVPEQMVKELNKYFDKQMLSDHQGGEATMFWMQTNSLMSQMENFEDPRTYEKDPPFN